MKEMNRIKGSCGESIAAGYLQDKGYRIIKQNYRTKYAEIDLIASDKDILVFVEVRTKIGEEFGAPEESIGKKKVNKIIRNIQGYLGNEYYSKEYRIDAVCIVLDENMKLVSINHYENITL